MILFLLLLMLFLHIVDDFYLQGILAKMKQREWWEKVAPDSLYRNDYKMALVEHAFSWTFMIMIPVMIFWTCVDLNRTRDIVLFGYWFIINVINHAMIDHAKANKHTINLIQDQCLHIMWVVVTWLGLIVVPVIFG